MTLQLQLPKGVTVIGFADGIGVAIVGEDIRKIEILTSKGQFLETDLG